MTTEFVRKLYESHLHYLIDERKLGRTSEEVAEIVTVLKALNKMCAKKVSIVSDGMVNGRPAIYHECPTCCHMLKVRDKYKHCPECGQKLRWNL